MIQVIEADQWSACGDAPKLLEFDDLSRVRGFRLREGDGEPLKGNVWFIKDETTGKPKIWKANYDSSD